MSAEETAQLINRQMFIFQQESFLSKVLNSDEFHPKDPANPDKLSETPWLTAHKSNVMKYLKRDLRVEPRVNAGAFELTFTSPDRNEAQRLVEAAAKEYLEFLKNQSRTALSARLAALHEAVVKADTEFRVKHDELAAYGKREQIDVLKAGFEIQNNALQRLNEDFMKADWAAASAEAQWMTFRGRRDALRASGKAAARMPVPPVGQVGSRAEADPIPGGRPQNSGFPVFDGGLAAGSGVTIVGGNIQGSPLILADTLTISNSDAAHWTESGPGTLILSGAITHLGANDVSATHSVDMQDVANADVLLSPEIRRDMEDDATLRALVLSRMQYEQELAIENGKTNPGSSRIPELTKRIEVIDKQLQETHDKLLLDALKRMAKMLEDEASSKRSLASYIGQIRKSKEDDVNILGQKLLQWDQRVADVKQMQESVNKLKAQEFLEKANQFFDDTRVKPVIDLAAIVVPTEPSWPEWPEFIWSGAAAGLVVGGLAAMGLAGARARRLNPPPQPALPTSGAFPTT